jgi:hypothetical protein
LRTPAPNLRRALSAAALAASFLPAAVLAKPNLDAESLGKLDKGEVLPFTQKVAGSNVLEGKAIGVFEDVPEAVVHVLLDLDKYKHYLPRIKDSRIVKKRGWHTFGVLETSLPWPAKDSWAYIKYTRYDKPGRVYEIKWWMVNGTLNQFTGSALVEPWNKDATRSVLTYTMLFEPKTSAPYSMISDGVKRVTRIIVDRTRLRLQALRKFNKLPKELLKS